MAFTELIKNFDNIRDYMRDFYIYGFKSRGDFKGKSARTYDNEKRRIESYLAPYMQFKNGKKGKRIYISMDTADIRSNPLYNAWKAKSFTDNDITLHFAILSALNDEIKNITDLTDSVSSLVDKTFDSQMVRIKANEYVQQGILCKEKQGKTDYYSLSKQTLSSLLVETDDLLTAICFFQEIVPFGFVGSTILDRENRKNDVFTFKHHYIVHTLEDGILLDLLRAIKEKKYVCFTNQSERQAKETFQHGVPMQIFVSVQSGRRYLCIYTKRGRRFHNYRLDYIKKVELLDLAPDFDELQNALSKNKSLCWGVSFGNSRQKQTLHMKLHIDEKTEQYVLERLKREGRGGSIEHVDKDTYLYTIELFDITEMMAWVKSFTGRIISLEGTNEKAIERFYRDMERMAALYGGDTYMEIFSEIYSTYFGAIEKVLRAAQKSTLTANDIENILSENTFSESMFHMLPKLQNGDWPFLKKTDSAYIAKFTLPESNPLTNLQKAWIKAILNDSKIRLFFHDGGSDKLSTALSDVEPLFNYEDFYIFDNVNDGDDFESERYREIFRTFLSAVRLKNAISVQYEGGKGNRVNGTFWPYKLEFSPKDNKFRAHCYRHSDNRELHYVLNLGRVVSAEYNKDITPSSSAACKSKDTFRQVVLEITHERNALERSMVHFAHFEKNTEYDGNTDKYTCTLRYNVMDETEVIIRVLSFGPTIRVLGPNRFVKEIRSRVEAQMRLITVEKRSSKKI